MATRSLTEVFILMRNNALQNRHLFSEQVSNRKKHDAKIPSDTDKLLAQGSTTPNTPEGLNDDRTALVSRDRDEEMGLMSVRGSQLPPEWVDGVEEIQFESSRIKEKMRELSLLHDKYLNRPTLDDNVDEEHTIDIQTQEITQMFMRCQRLVQQISACSRHSSPQEQKVATNIVSSLARMLQEMSTNFRKAQSSYLRKLKTREEHSKQYFGTDLMPVDSQAMDDMDDMYDRGFTQSQLMMVEDNTVMVQAREKEITQIVKSITDLNDIFKDLASMIVDQGTILDRIDYNIEQTSVRVEKGLEQLQKASKYQKKNRKMLIIVILFVILIILIIILIFFKS